ncbi:HTH-type transcriptional regulator TtgR [Paraburkholderia ultramafica]|uniref:HTH-type transcriptional regulator TtgR n=1 Tax=Paraburkholderia ultramafica TaxID=1544867 RepID=A0A6S7CG38_9BURK|nr:TetR family transcriptional regulator [Paraburkholderia ultramafica]CAB3788999.1 HTH-type transcriptional regulator TtgR [Paraburkholderia ultramafica]
MKRKKVEALGTRAQILRAAEQVFVERGVSRASLSEIADLAGVTRGAVYWHFKDKMALLETLFEHASLADDPFVMSWSEGERDPLGQLERRLAGLLATVLSAGPSRRFYLIMLMRCEMSTETEWLWSRLHASWRGAEHQMARALRAAIARNQLSAELDPYLAATFIHSTVMGLILRSLREPPLAVSRAVARLIVSQILSGIKGSAR